MAELSHFSFTRKESTYAAPIIIQKNNDLTEQGRTSTSHLLFIEQSSSVCGLPCISFPFILTRDASGAFFNGVFLLALALSIFLQSIERFINVEPIKSPVQVLIIGSIGLFLNIISALVVHGKRSISFSCLNLRLISFTLEDHGGHGHGNETIALAVSDETSMGPLRDSVVSSVFDRKHASMNARISSARTS